MRLGERRDRYLALNTKFEKDELKTPDLPFGAIKNSGYGRELSSMSIQGFVNKKRARVTSIDGPA